MKLDRPTARPEQCGYLLVVPGFWFGSQLTHGQNVAQQKTAGESHETLSPSDPCAEPLCPDGLWRRERRKCRLTNVDSRTEPTPVAAISHTAVAPITAVT